MAVDSPSTLRRFDAALASFLAAYNDYLDGGGAAARARAVSACTAANQALDALGFEVGMMPPPALGGYSVTGLFNVAFLHERYTWGEPQVAIDVVTAAQAHVSLRLEELQRRRRNPLYWGDRLLRAVLGFPVYLVGLVVGVSPERIARSPWGDVIRLAGVAAEVVLVVIGGRQVGWW